MDENMCKEIANDIDERYDDIDKKFILWELLTRFRTECLEYANKIESEEVAEFARLQAKKCDDIKSLIGHDLW